MTLADRLRAALAQGMAREAELLIHDNRIPDFAESTVPAGVLIAVTDRDEPGVILTQRPDTMRKHPGQIAFPGGRMDPEDDDIIAAALREAEEEIGLASHHVEIVGTTDLYRTVTGFAVMPVIGVLPPDLPLVANEAEVADIFEVPLSFLLDRDNHVQQFVDWNGARRAYYEMIWRDRRIWGATAAMIVNLSRRISWPL